MENKNDRMKYDNGDNGMYADMYADMYVAFSCVDCCQEFDSRKELEEQTKHQDLSKPRE